MACVSFATFVASANQERPPTKGPIPVDKIDSRGMVNRTDLPDFLSKVDPNGHIYGYSRAEDSFPEWFGKNPSDAPYDVYDSALEKVIGVFIPGRGFQPGPTEVNLAPVIFAPPSTAGGTPGVAGPPGKPVISVPSK